MPDADKLPQRRGSVVEAQKRLEIIRAEAALRKFLYEDDVAKVDGVGLEAALEFARAKGGKPEVLLQGEKRLEEWQFYQAKMATAEKGVDTWKVVTTEGVGGVKVYLEMDSSSPVLSEKMPGEVFRAVADGDWVKMCDQPGYMPRVQASGFHEMTMLEKFHGAAPNEGGQPNNLKWIIKFLGNDRQAREAFTFLSPEFHSADLMMADTSTLGDRILALGSRLYEQGSLPGNETWELEESPEIMESIECWKQALQAWGAEAFDVLMQKAARLAHEGYSQMGRLAPRLSSLRWNCCMNWLAARSEALLQVSTGASMGTLTPERSTAANRQAKSFIFGLLKALTKEREVLVMFDYDLIGHGVWADYKRMPLPKIARKEWYRRGMIFDLAKLCYQALQVSPEDMNPAAATLVMVQPYLTPDWILAPEDSIGFILRQHSWTLEFFPPAIDDLHTKALVQGRVLHMDAPPEFEHDFTDPEVIAKVQRGEDLGKGLQADGLPGSVHPSIALFHAAYCAVEHVQNVRVYPGLLELEGFFEMLLKYGPPLSVLELQGAGDAVTENVLSLIGLAGGTLQVLDLSECSLTGQGVDALIESLELLPNLKHLDVAHNKLDGEAAVVLMTTLCECRIDIPSVRLDGNPLGDLDEFKHELMTCLIGRGEQVVAGGELVLHIEDNMMRWCPFNKEGTLAHRLRDESSMGGAPAPRAIAIKEVRNAATAKERSLHQYETEDPAAQTAGGKDWLARQRKVNEDVLNSPLVELYKNEIKVRVAAKDAAEALEREKREAAGKQQQQQKEEDNRDARSAHSDAKSVSHVASQ